MNKEFMVLSDGNLAVTNESGNISKRTSDNNSQEILLAENKIEIIDNKLEKLKKNLHDQEGVVFLSKWMLISQPILLLLISTGMFIYGGVTSPSDFLTYALYNGVKGLVYGTICCGTAATYFGIVKPIYKKKVRKTNSEIIISQKLKEDYEKELTDIKEKQLTIEPPTISINEPISLVEKTNAMETQINEEISKNYTETLSQQPKKLVLKRNNKPSK